MNLALAHECARLLSITALGALSFYNFSAYIYVFCNCAYRMQRVFFIFNQYLLKKAIFQGHFEYIKPSRFDFEMRPKVEQKN